MKKITVNSKEFSFSGSNLPVLIHGEDRSGASLYTITLLANLYKAGMEVIVLCGYSMAKEEFEKQVGNGGTFYTKEKEMEFLMEDLNDRENRVICIKNVEMFSEGTISTILGNKNIIISGDLNKCPFKNNILGKPFATKILFSKLSDTSIPELKKYEGFVVAEGMDGAKTSVLL